jgi:hypothetical protein
MIAVKMADQKLLTSNFSLQRDTNISIAALTTTKNRPNVKITAGRVKSLRSEPRVALSRPKRSATHRYVVNPPITSIPGINAVATQKESANAAHRSNNFTQRL